MHLKAREREEPFGAMVAWADGRRSGIPADFRQGHVDLLADLANRSANTVLKARLADVCWLLDRRRTVMGPLAIGAYVDTIESIESGALTFPLSESDGALEYRSCDLLRRALYIGRAIGSDKPEVIRARNAVVRIRKQAIKLRKVHAILWFAELDIELGISGSAAVAVEIEDILSEPADANVHLLISLWRLAARGYHLGKQNDDKYRCQI